MYSVKEVFLTLQGEGRHVGRVAVFCRFSGCNLWSGREEDRDSATCTFCDTDFVGTDGANGGKFPTAESLVRHIDSFWQAQNSNKFVVLTGGEPLLQVDEDLVAQLHSKGYEIAVETNGTLEPPAGIDWITVSPKSDASLRVTSGDELKLVFPQDLALPDRFAHLAFRHFYLQPKDDRDGRRNLEAAIDYCFHHPLWRLSYQTHKAIGIR